MCIWVDAIAAAAAAIGIHNNQLDLEKNAGEGPKAAFNGEEKEDAVQSMVYPLY
jgi:hypothetical protein